MRSNLLSAKNFFIGFITVMANRSYIMANLKGLSFVKYRGDSIRLSQRVPKTVDDVWIGVAKRPDKTKRITTYRDKNGNIIERCFDLGDGYLRNRIYQNKTTEIGSGESVKSTIVKEFKIRKRMLKAYFDILEDYKEEHPPKTTLWTPIKVIANHLSTTKNGEKILSQVKITDMETPTKEIHTFIEFPRKTDKNKKTSLKLLSYMVNTLTGKVLPKSKKTEGVKFPSDDSFLNFRAMDINDAIEPITRFFVKKRSLKKADIKINPEYYPQNEDEKLFAAHFDPNNGSINFNINYRPASKTGLVGTAAHEAEHGWQYFLKALSGHAAGDWEEGAFETFGKLCDEKLVREARRYTKSIENYTPLSEELKQSGKIDEYRDNYIEKMANKAGEKARKKYDIEGKQLRRSFPHIPEKFL